jgi:hypothetical protein
MKNRGIVLVALIIVMVFSFSCKLSEEISIAFNVVETSGYSKIIFNTDRELNGNSTLNFFMAVKNETDQDATIVGWKFKVMHNIVTLCEINNSNFQNFKLEVPTAKTLKANQITGFYVNTLKPYENNMINNQALGFNDYMPTNIIVELSVEDSEGNLFTISERGKYGFDKEIKNQSNDNNILGEWELFRTVKNNPKAKQKLVFVGTKTSGEFVIYDLPSNDVFDKGKFSVLADKQVQLTGESSTKYWGEFIDSNSLKGTLIIKERNDTKTGTWTANKK